MARETHQREDLLRDARALVPRAMLRMAIEGRDQEVFAGFRGASLSVYFGEDPVYHFNDRGELRRAFADDRLVKAERGRLAFLTRRQSPTESVLQRAPHDAAAQRQLLQRMQSQLAELASALASGAVRLVGAAPPDGDAVQRLSAWLAMHPAPPVAASPRVG